MNDTEWLDEDDADWTDEDEQLSVQDAAMWEAIQRSGWASVTALRSLDNPPKPPKPSRWDFLTWTVEP